MGSKSNCTFLFKRGLKMIQSVKQKSVAIPEQKLEKTKKIFQNYPVDVVYLFGSQLNKKNLHPESDYDFAILFSKTAKTSERSLLRGEMMDKLFAIFGLDKTQVVDLEKSPLLLQFEAIQPCEIIFCRNEKRRIEFETKTSRRYHDQLPYFQRDYKQLTGSKT